LIFFATLWEFITSFLPSEFPGSKLLDDDDDDDDLSFFEFLF